MPNQGKKRGAPSKKSSGKGKASKASPPAAKSPKKKTQGKPKSQPSGPARTKDFYIAGIGASAGGLEALERFFENMPEKPGMAFVVVPHLKPGAESRMPEIVQRHCRLQVRQVEDEPRIQPDEVYIIPADKELEIHKGVLHLGSRKKSKGSWLPIDHFFRSLAHDQREKAIGIVLSGSGTDGTVGLKAIKEELGMAMVQDLESAQYKGMPQSALDSGAADFVLPPEEMPEQLIRYVNHFVEGIRLPPEEEAPSALERVFSVLQTVTGHDFSMYKPKTILRRISRRMSVNQIEDLSSYAKYLRTNPQEARLLFKELLISVTNFFRDPEAFECLKDILIQYLKGKPDGYDIRAWVPGCATGEEAYSLAMVIRECLDEIQKGFKVQIFASDIDDEAVDKARRGVYQDSNALDISPDRLKRFFNKEDDSYRIKKEIRDMLIFAVQNAVKDPPFTRLDIICCRNLLIYLNSGLQKKILPLFHHALKPEGILFLGSAETIGEFTDLFRTENKKWKIFRSTGDRSAEQDLLEFPLRRSTPDIAAMETKPSAPGRDEQVEKILLQTYVPPCVIVNKQGQALFFYGRTGKYLEPAEGKARLNILDMARPGLRTQLSGAIHRAFLTRGPVVREGIQVTDNGGTQMINLRVTPFQRTDSLKGLAMVVFEDVDKPKKKEKAAPVKKMAETPPGRDARGRDLEQELQDTKENLQTTIEELETSNEELKSTNEELESTNEELQSTNEELEQDNLGPLVTSAS
jgi:two-component system CheB/CheR fusion protein